MRKNCDNYDEHKPAMLSEAGTIAAADNDKDLMPEGYKEDKKFIAMILKEVQSGLSIIGQLESKCS